MCVSLAMKLPQVSEFVQLSERKIEELVKEGSFPAPVRIGGSVRWDREGVREWWEDLKAKR